MSLVVETRNVNDKVFERCALFGVGIDGPIYEYACHDGNYSVPNILKGARAQEM